jgi:putative membrane protein
MWNGFCHFGNWGNIGTFGTWGWVAMILQMVFWVGLIAGIVLLVFWAIRGSSRTTASMSSEVGSRPPTAIDILKTRYARGEITREQYEIMKQDVG